MCTKIEQLEIRLIRAASSMPMKLKTFSSRNPAVSRQPACATFNNRPQQLSLYTTAVQTEYIKEPVKKGLFHFSNLRLASADNGNRRKVE